MVTKLCQAMDYIVVKQTKSVGLAILLTLLLGPIGLFYASVSGGLIMTFIPFVLSILTLTGIVLLNSTLFWGSFIMLLIFTLVYWVICIVWAVIAVNRYNQRLIHGASPMGISDHRSDYQTNKTSNLPSGTHFKTANSPTTVSGAHLSDKPSLQDWRKLNPHRSINDYFRQYPATRMDLSMETSSGMLTKQSKRSGGLEPSVIIAGAITIIILLALILFFDPGTKSFRTSKIKAVFGKNTRTSKEIKEQIELVYFGLANGAYTSEGLSGTTPENLPFYNSDLNTLMVMGLLPLGMISGPITIEAKDITIHNIDGDHATVSYDLTLTLNRKVSTARIIMVMKKVAGKWKLDGQKFFPHEKLL